MQSLFRTTTRFARPSPPNPFLTRTALPPTRLYATQSYGGDDMSGHAKSDQANPKANLEHPGPESPASKGGSASSTSQSDKPKKYSPPSTPSGSTGIKQGEESTESEPKTSHGGSPAINNPGPAPEHQSEEVRKHNEAVAKSHDRPVNQIDQDGKVEKGYWQGECWVLCFLFLSFSGPLSLVQVWT